MDVLGLVGGVEQGLGAVGELTGGGVEHDATYVGADLGVARLAGEHDDVPLGLEARWRRIVAWVDLPGALAALEADEQPGRRVGPGEAVGHGVHPSCQR